MQQHATRTDLEFGMKEIVATVIFIETAEVM